MAKKLTGSLEEKRQQVADRYIKSENAKLAKRAK